MSAEQVNLTDEQRANIANRIHLDASLVHGPDNIREDGSIIPDNEDVASLYKENVIRPQIPEFNKTRDGQAIEQHVRTLRSLRNILGSYLGYGAFYNTYPDKNPHINDFIEFSDENDLGIDFHRIEKERTERKRPDGSTESPYISQLFLSDLTGPLEILSEELIEHPQFRIGNTVKVMRNGRDSQPNYLQDGWKVSKILANGQLQVEYESSKGPLRKNVRLNQLVDWNENN